MWETWLTAASLFVLAWNGVAPLPASGFDISGLARLLGAFLLLFVLPGIALNRLVLRRCSFGAVTTIATTLTLSMSTTIVGGFILDLFPGGLRPLSWFALLGTVAIGGLLAAFALEAVERAQPVRTTMVVPYEARRLRFSPMQLALLAAALALTGYAFVSAVTNVQTQRRSGFTQLWITTDKRSGVATLTIGVTSQELAATNFRLVLVSGDRTIAEWPALQLGPGQSFFARVDVDPATLVVPSVSVVLYRLDNPSTPYRLVQAGVQP